MTKRMLSLLLALVMTLSLCVPALAADEFAAEAVTEVEEQAPEAPEAPVEPEAEEPAEEPVVDEPAVEEAVADAPEAASVMPEEMADEPLLVALGVVSKKAHWELYKAVKAADEVIDDVKAGKLRQQSFTKATITWSDFDFEKDDPFEDATADFLKKYDAAKEMLDAVDGAAVDYDVTTSTVETAAGDLAKYVDKNASGAAVLTDDTTTGTSTAMAATDLKALIGAQPYNSYSAKSDVSAALAKELEDYATADVTTDSTWKMAYKASYLTALQAAIDAVNDYKAESYAEYVSVVKKIVAAMALEADASMPVESDLPALKSAISNANAQVKNYKAENYVLHLTEAEFNKLIADANGLMSETLGTNGFDTGTTYYDYNKAIEDLTNAIRKVSTTIGIEDFRLDTTDKKVELTLSVTKFGGSTKDKGDGKTYGIAFKYGDYWFKDNETATNNGSKTDKNIWELTGDWNENDKYPGKWVKLAYDSPAAFGMNADGTKHDTWAVNDKLTVYFYEKKADGNGFKVNDCGSKTITITAGYNGPVVTKAEVKTAPTGITIPAYDNSNNLTTSGLPATLRSYSASSLQITVTLSGNVNTAYPNNKIVVTGTGDKVAASVTKSDTGTSVDITSVNDEYLVGGSDNKAVLKVATTTSESEIKDEEYIARGTPVALTVDPLSKWSEVTKINKWLDEAGKLVPSDYDKVTTTRNDVKDVATAFQVINKDIGLIKTALTSATVANSAYNQKAVTNLLADLIEVCQYLHQKTTDLTKMYELVEKAEELLAEGDDEYTFDSFYYLKDVKDENTKYSSTSFQSDVDKYVTKLQAAIDGLTEEGAVSKTGLNASIAAAEALKEEDYTEESWAANKDAIEAALAAAKTVAANANATQAQIDAAKAALDAAVAKLEKVGGDEPSGDENHPAPAGGTGWSYDKTTGEYYFYKNGKLVANYWVGKVDGASQWAGNWYYVGSDGKLLTGMQYVDDLHGGKAWYFLQPTNDKGEIGKMLTGWQWVGGEYGECYFSNKNGESGKCTWSELKGDWNGTAFVK